MAHATFAFMHVFGKSQSMMQPVARPQLIVVLHVFIAVQTMWQFIPVGHMIAELSVASISHSSLLLQWPPFAMHVSWTHVLLAEPLPLPDPEPLPEPEPDPEPDPEPLPLPISTGASEPAPLFVTAAGLNPHAAAATMTNTRTRMSTS
jgi:hypothetical protein